MMLAFFSFSLKSLGWVWHRTLITVQYLDILSKSASMLFFPSSSAHFRPVRVEASLALVTNVLSEDGLEGAETAGSLDVAHYADCHHWGCLDDSDGFHNLLLVRSRSNSVDFTENVSHTSFVPHEGSQVTWLGLVVFREGLDFAAVTSTPFPREESKGTVPRCSELTVTHF